MNGLVWREKERGQRLKSRAFLPTNYFIIFLSPIKGPESKHMVSPLSLAFIPYITADVAKNAHLIYGNHKHALTMNILTMNIEGCKCA